MELRLVAQCARDFQPVRRLHFDRCLAEPLDDVADVLAEVRAQYTIGYVPTNTTADGAWRKVEVKVKRKDCRVRARKGYFGPFKKSG